MKENKIKLPRLYRKKGVFRPKSIKVRTGAEILLENQQRKLAQKRKLEKLKKLFR